MFAMQGSVHPNRVKIERQQCNGRFHIHCTPGHGCPEGTEVSEEKANRVIQLHEMRECPMTPAEHMMLRATTKTCCNPRDARTTS